MIRLDITLRKAVDVQKLMLNTQQRMDLGTARAADVVAGALRRYSTSEVLHGRTGNLARTWEIERLGMAEYRAFNRSPQARLLEYGGDVEPKNANMLAIPIGEGVTERGVPRFTGPRASDIPSLFAFRSRRGNVLLAHRTGSRSMDLYFVLKEKVSIPAFRYATKAVESARAAAIAEIRRALKS